MLLLDCLVLFRLCFIVTVSCLGFECIIVLLSSFNVGCIDLFWVMVSVCSDCDVLIGLEICGLCQLLGLCWGLVLQFALVVCGGGCGLFVW